MSKVVISPLLNSLFSRSDRMTKDEANVLVSALSSIGSEDCKMSLAQSTVARHQKANYVVISNGQVEADTVPMVRQALESSGWNIVNSRKGDGQEWWIYFLRG